MKSTGSAMPIPPPCSRFGMNPTCRWKASHPPACWWKSQCRTRTRTGSLVKTARRSTGSTIQATFGSSGSAGAAYWTPEGDFVTFRKRPSRHMSAGNLASGYDLPGVPWVAYITEEGVSFHGTYWHNDFGTPRSHGCINMNPEAAHSLYRWTYPVVPRDEMEVWVSYGTSVKVHI